MISWQRTARRKEENREAGLLRRLQAGCGQWRPGGRRVGRRGEHSAARTAARDPGVDRAVRRVSWPSSAGGEPGRRRAAEPGSAALTTAEADEHRLHGGELHGEW